MEKEKVRKKDFVLNEETDFTPVSLREFLNDNFRVKLSGKPFTAQDIQSYENKGKLPATYGGCAIEIIKNSPIGIKIFRIPGLRDFVRDKFRK